MLPDYRGRAPVNWMLVNGEREAASHCITWWRAPTPEISSAQRAVAIDDSDTALTLYRKLVPLGVELIREFHPMIVAGTRAAAKAGPLAGQLLRAQSPEDGRIDWRWPARRIFNLVRAVTHPYPGAFCFVGGRKLLIWQARIAHEDGTRGAGRIVPNADGAIEVAAGEAA